MSRTEQASKTLDPIAVSLAEAVEMTGISKSKLYQAMKAGELKSLKVGGRRLFRPNDLADWLFEYYEYEDNHA